MQEVSKSPSRPNEFWIGLSAWVIQDGNYTNFVSGEVRQFAVEFYYNQTRRLRPSSVRRQSCKYAGTSTDYQVEAEVQVASPDFMEGAFVLDFGLKAFCGWMVLDTLEPPIVGDWLSGVVGLGIDPFMWMDVHARKPEMPPLIYTWSIEEIQQSTTPLVTVPYGDPRYGNGPDEGPQNVLDLTRESWSTVERTDAWEDRGPYRLRCRLHDHAPDTSMARSGPASPYGSLPA